MRSLLALTWAAIPFIAAAVQENIVTVTNTRYITICPCEHAITSTTSTSPATWEGWSADASWQPITVTSSSSKTLSNVEPTWAAWSKTTTSSLSWATSTSSLWVSSSSSTTTMKESSSSTATTTTASSSSTTSVPTTTSQSTTTETSSTADPTTTTASTTTASTTTASTTTTTGLAPGCTTTVILFRKRGIAGSTIKTVCASTSTTSTTTTTTSAATTTTTTNSITTTSSSSTTTTAPPNCNTVITTIYKRGIAKRTSVVVCAPSTTSTTTTTTVATTTSTTSDCSVVTSTFVKRGTSVISTSTVCSGTTTSVSSTSTVPVTTTSVSTTSTVPVTTTTSTSSAPTFYLKATGITTGTGTQSTYLPRSNGKYLQTVDNTVSDGVSRLGTFIANDAACPASAFTIDSQGRLIELGTNLILNSQDGYISSKAYFSPDYILDSTYPAATCSLSKTTSGTKLKCTGPNSQNKFSICYGGDDTLTPNGYLMLTQSPSGQGINCRAVDVMVSYDNSCTEYPCNCPT